MEDIFGVFFNYKTIIHVHRKLVLATYVIMCAGDYK